MKIAPLCVLAVTSGLLIGAAPVKPSGHDIVAQGNGHGAPACSSCHGPALTGDAMTGAPAIAGLSQSKILERLAHYAGPQGHNASMKMVATALTDAERQAVASYIATLPGPRR
jgi:cytochrome c553